MLLLLPHPYIYSSSSLNILFLVPPLTLENVVEAVKGVRNLSLRELGRHLLGSHGVQKQADILCQHHNSAVKTIVEAFLLGKGDYQPSWRRVIHALYKTNEGYLADLIKGFAESVQGERAHIICMLLY